MANDPHMKVIREQINDLIELCAVAAASGGAEAVRALKIPPHGTLPAGRGVYVSEGYANELAEKLAKREREGY